MSMFDGIDLNRLFDHENTFAQNYVFPELTEELIKRAEETMGYRLPESYKELLRFQNGGSINPELEEVWLAAIYGIAPEPDSFYGLEAMFDNWKNEWEYPDIGIPFGETQSAGHDMYYMDFRETDENGEPRIVRIDNEMNNEVFVVAPNFVTFIQMILKNEPFDEIATGEGGPDKYIAPEPRKKQSLFQKLFSKH